MINVGDELKEQREAFLIRPFVVKEKMICVI